MHAKTPEQHVYGLVAHYAHALHVKAPRVRFVRTSSGPCYEALFNRIEIDAYTLALPEPVLTLIVAHEVAHATQRGHMLLDLAWMSLGTAVLFFVPCYLCSPFHPMTISGALLHPVCTSCLHGSHA